MYKNVQKRKKLNYAASSHSALKRNNGGATIAANKQRFKTEQAYRTIQYKTQKRNKEIRIRNTNEQSRGKTDRDKNTDA